MAGCDEMGLEDNTQTLELTEEEVLLTAQAVLFALEHLGMDMQIIPPSDRKILRGIDKKLKALQTA